MNDKIAKQVLQMLLVLQNLMNNATKIKFLISTAGSVTTP
jgi:hypothetical protein